MWNWDGSALGISWGLVLRLGGALGLSVHIMESKGWMGTLPPSNLPSPTIKYSFYLPMQAINNETATPQNMQTIEFLWLVRW